MRNDVESAFTAFDTAIENAEADAVSSGKGYTDAKVQAHAEAVTTALAEYVKNVTVSNISGVTVTGNNTNAVTINFEELIIDCGEF